MERAIKTIQNRIDSLKEDIEYRKPQIARLISELAERQTGLEDMEKAIREYERALEKLKA